MISTILNIAIVLLILGILVFIHELGHFVAAKLMKVRVDEFAIGMGPKIFKKKRGETIYSLNLFPIGGYVKILGEGDDPSIDPKTLKDDPRSFQNKRPAQKFFILIAGVVMNLILAIILYYVVMFSTDFKSYSLSNNVTDYKPLFGKEYIVPTDVVGYSELADDGAAKAAGMPEEGFIKTFAGRRFELTDQFSRAIAENAGKDVKINVCTNETLTDGCEEYNVKISDEGKLGVILVRNYAEIRYEGWQKFFAGFVHPINVIHQSLEYLPIVIAESAKSSCNKALGVVASPVALYVIVDEFSEQGISWLFLVDLVASLSFTLFIMNLLPIPALDGGRLVFVLYEAIFGKPVNPTVEAWSIRISFILLILLMLVIFFKDVFFFNDLVCTITG